MRSKYRSLFQARLPTRRIVFPHVRARKPAKVPTFAWRQRHSTATSTAISHLDGACLRVRSCAVNALSRRPLVLLLLLLSWFLRRIRCFLLACLITLALSLYHYETRPTGRAGQAANCRVWWKRDGEQSNKSEEGEVLLSRLLAYNPMCRCDRELCAASRYECSRAQCPRKHSGSAKECRGDLQEAQGGAG